MYSRLDWEIDKSWKRLSCAVVSLLRRISVLMLLAVWLTATQHCAMEAAGIWGGAHGETNHASCASGGPCTNDGCHVVERGSITASQSSVKVPVPDLQALTCQLFVQLVVPSTIAERPAEYSEGMERTIGWVPTWHFERRAAPSPRAPSLILA